MDVQVAEAAEVLGVSAVRVRQLLTTGQLRGRRSTTGRWLVDRDSVRAYRDARRQPGQPLAQRSALLLLDALEAARSGSGTAAPTSQDPVDQHRLRRRVEQVFSSAEPAGLLRQWLPRRYRTVPLVGVAPDALRDDPRLVLTGLSDPRLGVAAPGTCEGHVHPDVLAEVRRDHFLVSEGVPNVWLHPQPDLPPTFTMSLADLADHGGERVDGVVAEVLTSW